MVNRRFKRREESNTTQASIRFENLEARNMLTADFGIAEPFASNLLTHIQNDVPVSQQMSVLRAHLNASPADEFELLSIEEDLLGFEHFKYQHTLNGIPVESSTYTVHARDGLIVSLSGEFHQVLDAATQTQLTSDAALQQALNHVGADLYVWQDQAFQEAFGLGQQDGEHGPGCCCSACTGSDMVFDEAHGHFHFADDSLNVDHVHHGHDISTEVPEGELVYINGQLSYKFDIYATAPTSRAYIFVNAIDGSIVDSHNQIHDIDVPANGPTLYDGNQSFTADFNGSDYRLREDGGANGPAIVTYDLNESTDYGDAVDFVSTSANFSNPDLVVGNQTHFGTEQTWEYFFTQHGRDSFDNQGATLESYVSFGSGFVNAFWNGSFFTYGDGNGTNRGPLVSLDIVGHEVTHGVVEHSAGLIYRNHSGALNESFADIFGEAIENYARGSNDWLIGGDIGVNGNTGQFRSVQNPNQFNDPDTYLGDYWFVGNGDQGGVHTNSGVQNKWFYILTSGEAGTNDTGHTYDVTGVGIDDASAIAYRNLTQYLTANSTYPAARVGAVQASIDLFGVGSQQHLSTLAAWDAVGVYDLTEELDLFPVQPRGSQVFEGSAINNVAFPSDTVEYVLGLDGNQTISLTVENISGDLLPAVTITDSSGNIHYAATATSTTDTIHLESLAVPDADVFTIAIAGDADTIGGFETRVLLNAGLEVEALGLGTNDDIASAQSLDFTSVTQGNIQTSVVDRLAVTGELVADGGGQNFGGDDFESGVLDPAVWETFSSTSNGRIVVADDTGTPNGNYALAFDVDTAGIFNLNEAILTTDLTGVTDINLTFSQISFGDEIQLLPDQFTGSFAGDGIAISEDGIVWHTIWSEASANGLWTDYEIDLGQAASDAGIAFNDEFKIKFQQYDNFPRPSDGRAFDNIQVGGSGAEDWYSLVVDPGETITVLATQLAPEAGSTIEAEIYDAAETLLASSVLAVNTFDSYIESFTNTSTRPEVFYVNVKGNASDYSLVVTRGGAFDLEDGFDQNITDLEGVLGYVSGSILIGAEPDDQQSGQQVNAAYDGVTLSNQVNGGNIFSVASAFTAPTGDNVFGASAANDDGFRDGVNEFRADFDDLQSFVSIDVGSDDTLDIAYLRAYDVDGNLLEEVVGDGAPIDGVETLTIQRADADIAYVVSAGVGSHTAPLDNLVFQDDLIDSDTYITTAEVGDTIEFRAYLPGGGPLEFENRLNELNGNLISLTLVDPNGTPVAFGNEIIEHTAELDGDYELLVSAVAFDGEYYVTRDTGIVSVEAFGSKLLDGVQAGGSLSDAGISDDVYFQLAPAPTNNPAKQKIDLLLLGEVDVFNPTSFGFRFEAFMSGGPEGDVLQTIELWDEQNSVWVEVDSRAISNTETSIDVSPSGNLDRFVHQTNGEVLARISFASESFSGAPFDWTIDVDQATWRVGEY